MRIGLLPRNILLGGVVAVACVGVTFAACDDSYRPLHGMGGGTTASTTSHGGGGGGVILGDSSVCPFTCSNDLKTIVDCQGVVQTTCTVDQGCANGVCMDDPCQAAEVSKSSYGCEYWALKTVQRPQADGACFVAFVANTWGKAVHLTVQRNGITLDPTKFAAIPQGQGKSVTYAAYDATVGIPVGEVAILFLSRLNGGSVVSCPIAPADGTETGVPIDISGDTGNGVGKAFHITSDYPVVAYQMTPYGGGQAGVTSATLLLPTSAWDTNYIAINAYKQAGAQTPAGNPSLDILASKDGTQVTLLPKVAIVGNADGGVPAAAPAGAPVTYTLNAGEFLQITQPAELTGSPIQSTQPVAVFGASACMEVKVDQPYCDSGQQQLPPVRALGSEYVGVRYRGRGADLDGGVTDGGSDEATQWRLVGAVDGTTLTWEPSAPPGAPTSIGLGEVAEFTSAGPFVVKSQDGNHPFYLGAYMTGGGSPPPTPSGLGGEGDPDWVNVVPPPQYLNDYVFFTDQTYPETDLVLVRTPSKVDGSFADVTLHCAGSATPQAVSGWQPIGNYQYTRVDLSTGDFMSVNGCTNGRQELTSALPFGVTVWGWGHASDQTQNVSYAYPAGAGFLPINMVVVQTTK